MMRLQLKYRNILLITSLMSAGRMDTSIKIKIRKETLSYTTMTLNILYRKKILNKMYFFPIHNCLDANQIDDNLIDDNLID